MSLRLVYLDSGILINAFRGIDIIGIRSLQILNNPALRFASSDFVELETLPKAIYNRQSEEAEFYQAFFDSVSIWATDLDQIIQAGKQIAQTNGLSGMDALHIAAALSVQCQEFITTEKPTKPLHRVKQIRTISIAT